MNETALVLLSFAAGQILGFIATEFHREWAFKKEMAQRDAEFREQEHRKNAEFLARMTRQNEEFFERMTTDRQG